MKNYEITEEQIKNNSEKTLKEWFPEVFNTELKIGKWYKNEDCGNLVFYNSDNKDCFGISYFFKEWCDSLFFNKEYIWKPATDSEVLEALKNEFKKQNPNVTIYQFFFIKNELTGWLGDGKSTKLFKNGVFTKFHTKEEAEKLLNAKII